MDPERPPPALISEVLEEIFLRVASPADLARASAACVSFRRLIADPSFLRRYRSLHPPLFLGFVNSDGFQPVEAPHPSAAVARAVAFSFDFLPRTSKRGGSWNPLDVRDGRVLVECPRGGGQGLVWDLAVCDPLSRGYLLLPPITRDLLASIGLDRGLFHAGASIIPSGGVEEDTSFRVITWIQSDSRLGVFIFSSGSSCWSVSTSIEWGDLGLDQVNIMISGQCAYDCFYWKLSGVSTVIKLDMNSMQFCTVDLPPGHDQREITVVESGGSKVAMFSLLISGGTSVDYYTFPQNGSEKYHEWHMKSAIPLPAHCTGDGECRIGGPHEGYIFIKWIPDEEDTTYSTFYSLEVKSFNIERVGRSYHMAAIHIVVSHHLCHQGGFKDMECYTFYCTHTPVLNSCGSFRASSLHSICCCPRANELVVNDHMIWSTSIGEPTNLLSKQLVHKHILEDDGCRQCDAASEEYYHLFFECPLSASVWTDIVPCSIWLRVGRTSEFVWKTLFQLCHLFVTAN